ncbi:MAG TPA: hypothetical protein VJ725_19345 [Thermoanaerobaculia bacterium]|nr:hypothetical protein [Thermoanaerobaculia bacterium]
MPFQWRITISRTAQGVVFNPDPLQAKTRDQIFWTNNDTEAHWPGLLQSDGTINTTFFMPNQIAPNGGTSSTFSPSVPSSFKYACSLHPNEQGTITVT